jgi:cellulose synthase/poly-beta-1,6-N-acetylglucosamine synthase-like glycosyltransferase
MYAIMIIIAGVLSIQCLCSLINLLRRKRTIKRDDTRSKMIVMVPCYNEGDKELRKTIDICLNVLRYCFISKTNHTNNKLNVHSVMDTSYIPR